MVRWCGARLEGQLVASHRPASQGHSGCNTSNTNHWQGSIIATSWSGFLNTPKQALTTSNTPHLLTFNSAHIHYSLKISWQVRSDGSTLYFFKLGLIILGLGGRSQEPAWSLPSLARPPRPSNPTLPLIQPFLYSYILKSTQSYTGHSPILPQDGDLLPFWTILSTEL